MSANFHKQFTVKPVCNVFVCYAALRRFSILDDDRKAERLFRVVVEEEFYRTLRVIDNREEVVREMYGTRHSRTRMDNFHIGYEALALNAIRPQRLSGERGRVNSVSVCQVH